ncbi:hypothetical protein KPH14_011793 [Odynerus spinipes]|uniref:tRNA pseudouridine synthase n=1 Tax=Odynerus spinipes TaxID=1348599 RepID=A0AAD9RW52_9HYME|nr:hypothetical protein KPH14_011793 [Odynerus spinipes]
MGKYLLKFSFIGTLYRGMQKHSNKNIIDTDSVQGAIEAALLTVIPKPVSRPKLYLTSRTDSGVHVLCSVAHTTLENNYNVPYDTDEIKKQLNRYFVRCSHFIRILECIPVIDDFNAKSIIKSKTYIYRFMRAKEYGEQRIPILESCHTFHLRSETFDIDRMKKATQLFMGLKDFRTFAAISKNDDRINYVRSLHSLNIEDAQPLMPFDELSKHFNYWNIIISSKGFVYNQVRRIVAALFSLGTGNTTERDINIMLQVPSHHNWNSSIHVVPAHALHLAKLEYDLDELNKYVISDEFQKLDVSISLIKNKSMNLKSSRTVITDFLGRRYEITNGIMTELTKGSPFIVDEKPDMHIACIIPGLFLSSQDPAVSIEILRKYDIRHVLSIGMNLDLKYDGIKYHHCELLDLPESNILLPIKICISIIHKNRQENILVHCNAGVSRSPTIVISYLMASEHLSYDEAYEKVKSKRNCIKPNSGFVQQLRALSVSSLL